MSLKKVFEVRKTLAFRMVIWYALIFSFSSFAAILILYSLITFNINKSREQELLNNLAEFSSVFVSNGMDGLKSEIISEAESDGQDKKFIRLMTSKGILLFSSDTSSWGDIHLSETAMNRISNGAGHIFETVFIPKPQNKARILYGMVGPDKIIQVGEIPEDEERFMAAFWKVYGPLMAGVTLSAAFIGWLLARRALLGVEEVARTALKISNGAFDQRVYVKAKDEEIKRLAAAFNGMLDRIEALIKGIKEISDNIAHDLRSPITKIRGIAEMALTSGNSIKEYEDMAANTIEECDHLLGITNTMLEISEAEAGVVKLALEKIDVGEVTRDICDFFQATAESKVLRIIFEAADNCLVYGDVQRLRRLLVNLLDNAVKYTPSGGTITVSVYGNAKKVAVSVTDSGVGISEEDLPHIFTRFYRCDRSRAQPGVGLGLSLASAIAHIHGGNITVKSTFHEGSTFTVFLPRSSLSC